MSTNYTNLNAEDKKRLQDLFTKYRDLDFIAEGPLGSDTLRECAKDAEQKFLDEAERLLGKDFSFQDFRDHFYTTED